MCEPVGLRKPRFPSINGFSICENWPVAISSAFIQLMNFASEEAA